MTRPFPFAILGFCIVLTEAHHGHGHEHHGHHENANQNPFIHGPQLVHAMTPKEPTWLEKYGPQVDQTFSGPLSFSHLPYYRCLEKEDVPFDIAILGMPFDTGVTYRPGWVPHALLSRGAPIHMITALTALIGRDSVHTRYVLGVGDKGKEGDTRCHGA